MGNTLLFIDTSILLDFYRIPQFDLSLDVFGKLQENAQQLILSEQVKNEFSQNRSKELKHCIDHLPIKIKDLVRLPTILDRTEIAGDLRRKAEVLDTLLKNAKKQLQDILEAPVEKGQEVGKVEIYLNKNLHFSEKIFTIDCVRRNSLWQKLYDVLAQW